MRGDGGVAGLVGHLDGLQGLGHGADLVELDEDGVAAAQLDALAQPLGVGHEQVVAHQLDLAAQLLGHALPAFPVLLVQAVLDGGDGVLLHQGRPVGDQLVGGEVTAALGLMIEALALGALPLGSGGVHGQHEVPARLVAGGTDGLQDQLDGILVAAQAVGSKAALVAHGGHVLHVLDQLLQRLEHLGAPTQALGEAGSAHGHHHELLGIHGGVSVCAAVEDVHHGHGQTVGVHAAQEAVQGQTEGGSGGPGSGDGHGQDGVGAQVALVLGAVGLQHGGVHGVHVRGVQTHNGLGDDGVHVLHGLQHALAAETALVAVPELQGLKLAGGSAAGGSAQGHGAVGQGDLGLHGGVAAGVNDLACPDLLDDGVLHKG